jgi:hypothetical protein
MDAICDRIDCALNQVEYDLHADSHETLFYPAFSQLLTRQSNVGWEYFLKGFLIKDWGYLQGQYYSQMNFNTRKYNSTRWVVRVLTLLNNFRLAMWTLRNSAIHGGPTQLSGIALQKRLIREVKDLYCSKDRSILSLTNKDLFKLPLRFCLKQGNHHLLHGQSEQLLLLTTTKRYR